MKDKYPDVEWNAIIALRHILIHEYYGIQSDILWRIVTVHLPPFEKQINKILENYTGE